MMKSQKYVGIIHTFFSETDVYILVNTVTQALEHAYSFTCVQL